MAVPIRESRPAAAGGGDLVDALLAASRVLVAITARSLANLDSDVTLVQYRAMVVLADGPQRIGDLAAALEVAPSTATRMCDRLVAKGLLQRFRQAGDRRSIWCALTTAGRDLVGAAMRERRTAIARLVRGRPGGAASAAVALLQDFVAAAGDVSQAQWWRRWRTADRLPADALPA
jgi:DNA-binding MarR family transcriptional regulator